MRRGPVIEACRLEGIGDDFINIGDISDDDAHSGGIIRGNDFQVGAARGVLARASNLLIENNRILNTLEAGIAMTESAAIQHMTIRGNHVEDTCLRRHGAARQRGDPLTRWPNFRACTWAFFKDKCRAADSP